MKRMLRNWFLPHCPSNVLVALNKYNGPRIIPLGPPLSYSPNSETLAKAAVAFTVWRCWSKTRARQFSDGWLIAGVYCRFQPVRLGCSVRVYDGVAVG